MERLVHILNQPLLHIREENYMAFIFARTKKDKGIVTSYGNTLDSLMLLTAIAKNTAEKLAEEKEISLAAAQNKVIDCIKDGINTVQ